MIKVRTFFTKQSQPQQPSIEEFDSYPVPILPPFFINTASFLIFLLLLILPQSLSLPSPQREKKAQLEKLQPFQGEAPKSLSFFHQKETQLKKLKALQGEAPKLEKTQLEKLQAFQGEAPKFLSFSSQEKTQLEKLQSSQGEAMKVHPLPKKRNSLTFGPRVGPTVGGTHKKLRRLPHIFNRVLELPFRSDADVSVEEGPDFFRFVAEAEAVAGGVRALMVEIHPGVTKIVVRPNGYLGFASLDELELDMWRFRLPESTRPELASAVIENGELVVTVPKGVGEEEEEDDGGEFMGGMGNNSNSPSARLVLVQ